MNVQEEASGYSPSPMVSAFLIKIYQLVDDAATDHVVSWGEDQTTFVVWNPSEMARIVLPFYFKHNNFFGFVKQLNLYGFRKAAPDRWEFAHEFFQKGAKHLLFKIEGWKTEKAASTRSPLKNSADDQHYSGFSDIASFTPPSQSPVMPPVEEALGSATFVSESERLAREGHAKLLFELTRIRCLYEQSLSVVRQQQHLQKESNRPQKCVSCTRDAQCEPSQHQHGGDFAFQVLDDFARKDSFCISTGLPSLENQDINILSLNSRRDLLVASTRGKKDQSCPSMKSVPPSCARDDLTSLTPASQSPMMVPACIEAGCEQSSVLTEIHRLKRDNAILLSELNHSRKLYTEALSIVEIQKKKLEQANIQRQHPSYVKIGNGQSGDTEGRFVDPAAAPSFDRCDAMQHKKNVAASPQHVYPVARKLIGCHDACEPLPQAASFDMIGEEHTSLQFMKGANNSPVRLFGVPLQSSRKRWRAEDLCGPNDRANTGSDDDEVVIIKVVEEDRPLGKMPSLKSVSVDSWGELGQTKMSRSIQ